MHSVHIKPSSVLFFLLSCTISSGVYAADDHGATCATATSVDTGTDTIGELTSGDTDYFSITLPGDGRLTMFTNGETNTTGKLFDADGLPLEEDSSDGSGSNFLISKKLGAGTYCLAVYGHYTDTSGLYSLRVEADFFGDDHGSSIENATAVENPRGATILGELSLYADVDYFRINTPNSGRLTLYTEGDTNTTGKLYDSNGIPLGEDSSDGSGSNFLISKRLDAGTYYLAVYGHYSSTSGTYSLRVEGDFFDDDHGSDCGSATTISESSIVGELTTYADSDYFRVKMPETGGILRMYTTGETNTTAKLYDENGIFLEENSSSGTGSNFQINRELDAGTYCLAVYGHYSNTQGSYTLVTEGDFVPASTLPPLCSGQSHYDPATGIVTIPDVRLGNSCYSVEMKKRGEGFVFDLTGAVPAHR